MLDFFNKTLEVIVPRYDDDGETVENSIITDSVQSLIGLTSRCSITETDGYYNFSTAISYKFKYLPETDRRDNNEFVHSLYTLIATMLLYYEFDAVYVNIDDEQYEFEVEDLESLQFTLDKLLFNKNEEV